MSLRVLHGHTIATFLVRGISMHTCKEAAVRGRCDCAPEFAGMRVHFIGIGGSGMSGAAALLMSMGADVSGSDLVPFDGMGALVRRGARIAIGHREEQLELDVELVVISAAVPASNPEWAAARARGIPVLKYAQLLGTLMRQPRKGVAIAGTHGKTTTTAMCAYLCRRGGIEPSFVAGAPSVQLGGNSGLGTGPHFIVESCEFDRSFLHFSPWAAAILNIEPDHLDCYRDLDEIVEAFAQFARNVHFDGVLIGNAEDPAARKACSAASARVELFALTDAPEAGTSRPSLWQAVDLDPVRGCYAFGVRYEGRLIFSTKLALLGRHNVANALAATALAYHAGVDPVCIGEALSEFTGVSRRLSWRGEGHGVTIVDDYAHHPTEIRATLAAAVGRYHPKRTWAIFQPHQRTRTHRLMNEFAQSFGDADEVILPDVYAAREAEGNVELLAEGDSPCSMELAARIRQVGGRATYMAGLDAVAEHVVRHASEGDLVLTMGAGDVWKVADVLVERICGPNRA